MKVISILVPDFFTITLSSVLIGDLELHEDDLKVEKSLLPSNNLAAFLMSSRFKIDLICHALLNSNDNGIETNGDNSFVTLDHSNIKNNNSKGIVTDGDSSCVDLYESSIRNNGDDGINTLGSESNVNIYDSHILNNGSSGVQASGSNSNVNLIREIRKFGLGADVVSKGELMMALRAGINPKKIVFSGVGKTSNEIGYAIDKKILLINAESKSEINEIERIAKFKKKIVTQILISNLTTTAYWLSIA